MEKDILIGLALSLSTLGSSVLTSACSTAHAEKGKGDHAHDEEYLGDSFENDQAFPQDMRDTPCNDVNMCRAC